MILLKLSITVIDSYTEALCDIPYLSSIHSLVDYTERGC